MTLLLALAIAVAPDWAAVDRASELAAAETSLTLCRREAEVTGQDVLTLCTLRAEELAAAIDDELERLRNTPTANFTAKESALEKLKAELDAVMRATRARFERDLAEGKLSRDEAVWLAGAQCDAVELAVLKRLAAFEREHPAIPSHPRSATSADCRALASGVGPSSTQHARRE